MRTTRVLAAGLVGLLVLAYSAHPTFASPVRSDVVFTPSAASAAYDIEAYDYYCTGGGSGCLNTNGNVFPPAVFSCLNMGNACAGLNYADAEAYGLPNGSTTGTPAAMRLECEQFTATGYRQAIVSVTSSTGDATYSGLGFDQGAIGGKGTLLDWAQENPDFSSNLDPDQSTSQGSSISASAFDPNGGYKIQGTRGSVTGIQNTDNGADTWNAGSFTITISGEIDTYDSFGVWQSSTTGTMSCQAGGAHANDLANSKFYTSIPLGVDLAYNEGELEWDYAQAPDLVPGYSCTTYDTTGNHKSVCTFTVYNAGNVTVTSPLLVWATAQVTGTNPASTASASAAGSCTAAASYAASSSTNATAAATAFVCSPVTLGPGQTATVLSVTVGGSSSSYPLNYTIVGSVDRVAGEVNVSNNTVVTTGTT